MKLFPRGCCKEKHFHNTLKIFFYVARVWCIDTYRCSQTVDASRECAHSFAHVFVFYDSECIPFELHAIYMCVPYFFSKRQRLMCARWSFSCVKVLVFNFIVRHSGSYCKVASAVIACCWKMYFSVLYRRYENRG